VVIAAPPRRAPQTTDLALPGDSRAFQTTAIFPRANGYLKKLYVDIGDHVKDGQLLAEIDTPEIDAQLNQAKAAVEQANAALGKAQNDFDLAKLTLERYEGFAKAGGVTQQQLDEKRNAFTQAKAILEGAKASVAGSQADVQRLTALQSFEKVYAPFAGTITARNYDPGALLSATTGGNGGGKEIFRIDQTDTLRIYVNVPQTYATSVKIGQKADFFVRNYPGRPFTGTVTRSTGAIDPQTRTLRFEVDFANKGDLLYAGMYGQVKFHVTQAQPPLMVPTSALVFNAQGTRVAIANEGRIQYRNVNLGRDFGQEIEVVDGIRADDLIVANPGERLVDGIEVQVTSPEKTRTASTGEAAPKKDDHQQAGSPAAGKKTVSEALAR
jgi:RND family efflux transporter MFP subunit